MIQEPLAEAKEEKKARILFLVQKGFTQEEAARAVGIHPRTLRKWKEEDVAFRVWVDALRIGLPMPLPKGGKP